MKNRIILLFIILILLFSACSREKSNQTAVELRFGYTTEPSTLDPLNPRNTADGRGILFNVFEGLVKPGTDGKMLPCIAETWSIEQNSMVYSFLIRENIYFHDSSLLTVQDVKTSLETAVAAGFTGLNRIKEIEVDGRQITITLNSPDTEFLPYLTTAIVKEEITDREKNIIGTGPFSIESYTTQRDLVLKRFDNYWGKKANLEKVTIVFFENNDAQILALRGGSIDGARLTGAMAAQLNKNNFDVFDSYSAAVQLMALNNAVPPFNDIRVRQALNYGINVQNIINAAFFGMGKPSGSPVIPGLSAYYDNSHSWPDDPEKAISLLSQAGFSANNRLTFEIAAPSNYAMHVDTAQVIVSQLAALGVDASIRLVDWNTWLDDVYRGRHYQATIVSLDSRIVSARNFLARYLSTANDNFIHFNSPEYDRVYNSILNETNDEQLTWLYSEAQKIVIQNAASVFLQDINYYFVFRSGTFAGVLNYPLLIIDFASIYAIEKK